MDAGDTIEQSQEDGKSESPKEVNENISQEPTIEQQPETTNPKSEIQKSETKNMEVHHHPDLHHRKKHWKEYFLEFLMIFLAVTLGFFAENIREHFAERNKERSYMQSLLEDLVEDTSKINNCVQNNLYPQNGRDTLVELLYNYQPGKTNVNELARLFMMYCFEYNIVRLTDHTITELKTSGNTVLIRKRSVANAILSYDDEVHFTEKQGDITIDFGEKNLENGNDILNIRQFLAFVDHGPSVFSDKNLALKKSLNAFPQYPDPKLVLKFANSVEVYIGVCRDYTNQLIETKKSTNELITLIKNEYNFN